MRTVPRWVLEMFVSSVSGSLTAIACLRYGSLYAWWLLPLACFVASLFGKFARQMVIRAKRRRGVLPKSPEPFTSEPVEIYPLWTPRENLTHPLGFLAYTLCVVVPCVLWGNRFFGFMAAMCGGLYFPTIFDHLRSPNERRDLTQAPVPT